VDLQQSLPRTNSFVDSMADELAGEYLSVISSGLRGLLQLESGNPAGGSSSDEEEGKARGRDQQMKTASKASEPPRASSKGEREDVAESMTPTHDLTTVLIQKEEDNNMDENESEKLSTAGRAPPSVLGSSISQSNYFLNNSADSKNLHLYSASDAPAERRRRIRLAEQMPRQREQSITGLGDGGYIRVGAQWANSLRSPSPPQDRSSFSDRSRSASRSRSPARAGRGIKTRSGKTGLRSGPRPPAPYFYSDEVATTLYPDYKGTVEVQNRV
ncbi:unnamed protein product, partial [Amoebophrya sp. A25]